MSNECQTSISQHDDITKTVKSEEFICGVVEGFYGKPWSFEQRIDLFKRLKQFGLNSFMYAPKDDIKHRAKWRHHYSEHEATELKLLIDESNACGIDFYYSLAPGLDMIYSDPQEVKALMAKYDQLVNLGCKSFAILFDDIEPNLNDKDSQIFQDYASAQVSVSNNIYKHLNCPKFLFCPTEYCESRAVPDVANSIYLNTLGARLHQGIDIMWSGPRVISRLITEESVDLLARVIRRPPLIWENLHANDYDKRRVFLGPYSGRSTKLISKLRGILTNPNCEYEANYIAIHTLAQWSKCNADSSPHNQMKQASEPRTPISCVDTRCEQHPIEDNCDSVYNPDKALISALKDWIPHIMNFKDLPGRINMSIRGDSVAREQLFKETQNAQQPAKVDLTEIDVDDTNEDMMADANQASSVSSSNNTKSDMETCSSPSSINIADVSVRCDSCDMPDANGPVGSSKKGHDYETVISDKTDEPLKDRPTISDPWTSAIIDKLELREAEQVIFRDMLLFIDLFYLPFEHGSLGFKLIQDLKWLRDNSQPMAEMNKSIRSRRSETSMVPENQIVDKSGDDDHNTTNEDKQRVDDNRMLDNMVPEANNCAPEVSPEYWLDKSEKLLVLCRDIMRVTYYLMVECPNRLLSLELQPYISDLGESITIVMDFIRFLRYRSSVTDRFYFSDGSKLNLRVELASSDEQEPWVHRSGLVGDIQRLISSGS